MVQFVDPRARVGINDEAYTLRVDLAQQTTPRVAFLANGFPDSVRFLDALRGALTQLLPGMQAVAFDKGNASVTVSDDMAQDIQGGEPHAVIAAYGH